MNDNLKEIVVLGGPNGAGKTTAAKTLLPEKIGIYQFVNADEIARGLSPDDPESVAVAAGRAMLERMASLIVQEKAFVFETTCSGRGHVAFLERARRMGWRVSLLFLWLPTPDAALQRVRLRVREGGHSIPESLVVRRYWKGLQQLRQSYLPLSDIAAVYDNSDVGRRLVAEKTAEDGLVIHDFTIWSAIQGAAP